MTANGLAKPRPNTRSLREETRTAVGVLTRPAWLAGLGAQLLCRDDGRSLKSPVERAGHSGRPPPGIVRELFAGA